MSATVAKLEFKQNFLAPIRCLETSDEMFFLARFKNKEISLNELKKEANALKQLATLKRYFVKLTNLTKWKILFHNALLCLQE